MGQNWKSGEIISLTSLRGVAALSVAAAHASDSLVPRQYIWVDFFFILSGFILVHAYKSVFAQGISWRAVVTFYKARFFRIYPLHLFTLGLLIALECTKVVVGRGFEGYNSPAALVQNIFLVQNWIPGSGFSWNMPAWSISTEVAAYFLFPLGMVCCISDRARACATLLAGFIVVGVTWYFDGSLTNPNIFRCFGGVLIGMAIYKLGPLPAVYQASTILLLPVFYTAVPDALAVPIFALMIASMGRDSGPITTLLKAKWLRFLGLISYSVYLVHFPVLQIFWLLDHRVLGDAILSGGWAIRAAATLALLPVFISIAILTYFFIEVPCREWGARRFVRP